MLQIHCPRFLRILNRNLVHTLTILGCVGANGLTQSRASADESASPPIQNAAPASQPASTAPKIECAAPSYSFGEVWAGDKVEHTFVIRNTGTASLIIPPNGVRPGCGCTIPGKYDDKIEPGQEGRIPVALNTEHQHDQVGKQITVESNDPITPRLQLSLSGKVKSPISMAPAAGAAWGQFKSGSPDSITVSLTNNLPDAWHLRVKTPTASQPSAFEVSLKETQPGKAAQVVVKLKKPIQEGSTYSTLTLETGFAKLPQFVVPASVYVLPVLQAVPPQITGVTIPGQPFLATVQLMYNREGEMKVEKLTPSDPSVQVELLPIMQGTNHRMIRVVLPESFTPPTNKPATITIQTNQHDLPSGGIVSIPIRVRSQTTQPAQDTNPARPLAVRTRG